MPDVLFDVDSAQIFTHPGQLSSWSNLELLSHQPTSTADHFNFQLVFHLQLIKFQAGQTLNYLPTGHQPTGHQSTGHFNWWRTLQAPYCHFKAQPNPFHWFVSLRPICHLTCWETPTFKTDCRKIFCHILDLLIMYLSACIRYTAQSNTWRMFHHYSQIWKHTNL